MGAASAAPMRGCAPSWLRRSIRGAAAIAARSASPSSVSVPTSVKTDRLWSGSVCTSSRRACAPSAEPMAWIMDHSGLR